MLGGFGPAVPHRLFRSVDCPTGVHAGHGPCVCHHAPLRVLHPSLPGRLPRPWVLVSGYSAGEGLSLLALSEARGLGEPLQELSGSISDFGLSGDEASNTSLRVFPTPKRVQKLFSPLLEFVLSAAAASIVEATSWCNFVPLFHRSGILAADALPSAPPQHCRSSPSRFRLGGLGCFLSRGSSVGVHRVPSVGRSSAGSSAARSRPLHRCLGFRLGRVPAGRPSVRLVVSVLVDFFDQPQGTACSVLWGAGFPPSSSGLLRVPLCGQNDLSFLSAEQGGYSFRDSQFGCPVDPSPLKAPSDPTGSSVHSREAQCVSGFSESSLPGPRLGVDLVSSGLPGASSSLACDHRPLRDLNECSASGVLCSVTDPQSAGTDAMMQSWDGLQAYASPPFGLLHHVLSKVRQSRGLELTLVAPFWPQHP